MWVLRYNPRPHRRGGYHPPGGTMSVSRIRPGAFASLSEGGGNRPLPPSAACGDKREGDRFSGGRSTRKPDDGRSTPSVIAAGGADSSLCEGAVESLSPRGRIISAPTTGGNVFGQNKAFPLRGPIIQKNRPFWGGFEFFTWCRRCGRPRRRDRGRCSRGR